MTAALKYKKYRLSTQHLKSFPSNILKTLELTPNKKKSMHPNQDDAFQS